VTAIHVELDEGSHLLLKLRRGAERRDPRRGRFRRRDVRHHPPAVPSDRSSRTL